MNIILIGFMGSGKSTIGKKLANRLQYAFVDMDREIQEEEKKSIAQIFKEQGEDWFRAKEQAWLQNFNRHPCVISTGGGTPCFHQNMERMNQMGKTVFLHVTAEILASRLLSAKQSRPLIENYVDNQENLTNYIRQKLNERMPFYSKAHIQIDASSFGSEQLNALVEIIKGD